MAAARSRPDSALVKALAAEKHAALVVDHYPGELLLPAGTRNSRTDRGRDRDGCVLRIRCRLREEGLEERKRRARSLIHLSSSTIWWAAMDRNLCSAHVP